MTMPTVEITAEQVYNALADLGYPIESEDVGRIAFLIQLVSDKVKLITHRDSIPSDLHNTVVGMVVGEFLAGKYAMGGLTEDTFEAAVKRISEGDTTIEYAYDSGSQTPEERFKDYVDHLRDPPIYLFTSVRRMTW